jgi:predicted Zn-dependent peptidase
MNNYKIDKLKNSLEIVKIPDNSSKTVTALVMVGTGSRNETRINNGISHFLEHMMFKGTEKYPDALSLATALDAVGGEFNAFTSKEYTGYYIKLRADKLEIALEILSDMLLNSTFKQDEIDKERGVILEEINMYRANPMMRLEDVFESCVYGDNSAGWEVIGTKDNIKKFQRKDFVNYYKKQYGVNNLHLVLAGNLPKNINALSNKYFADFSKGKKKEPAKVSVKQKAPQIKVEHKENDQINLALGVRAFAIDDKREATLKLMQVILGGSMSSRLFTEIREKRGLAYYVKTSAELYRDSGYLAVEAGLKNEAVYEAIEVILNEFKKLSLEPVSAKELKRTKEMIKGRMALSLEGSDAIASFYARQSVTRKSLKKPKDFLAEMNKVSSADILKLAKELFRNDRLNLAIIGPMKENAKLRKLVDLNK